MPVDLERWANKQVLAAIARGIHPLDAQAAVKAFLQLLPPEADPNMYIAPTYQLMQDLPAMVDDARATWYERVDPRFARLLDASE